ncbi:hypothetical protein [Rubripirellula lacrimiformis]|nr:hypothetical protein [Rubripirellula lacrimiformis]
MNDPKSKTHACLRTYEIGQHDWRVPIHTDFADWLGDNVRNIHAKNELAIGFRTWLKSGEFSINQKRLTATSSSNSRAATASAIRSCPMIKQVAPAERQRSAAVHKFVGLRGVEIGAPDSATLPCLPALYLPPSLRTIHLIDGGWLHNRAVHWADWCEANQYDLPTDYLGRTSMGRSVFESLSKIEFPRSSGWLTTLSGDRSHESRLSPREHGYMYQRRCVVSGVIRKVRVLAGRCYHSLTQCPRELRRLLRIGGERLAEADVAASYFTFLAGQLPESAEKRRLVSLLQSGQWYEWLADATQMPMDTSADRDSVKVEAQRQLLFGIDWRVCARPMWKSFSKTFPKLAALINRLRKSEKGPSGLSHFLSRLEGQTMNRAYGSLVGRGVACLPLHDGILVGESSVEMAAGLIREVGAELLGFESLVRAK